MAVALPQAIDSVKQNLRGFSTSLANVYRQNTDRYSQNWVSDICDLRSNITSDASQYAREIIPKYDDLMDSLDDFFEHYMNFTFDAWVENLDYIAPDAEKCTTSCTELAEEHVPILTGLKKRRNMAEVLTTKVEDDKEEHEKEMNELKELAERKKDNAVFYLFIPLIGIPFYFKEKWEGEGLDQSAAAKGRQVSIDENTIAATKDISDALEKVIEGLNAIAGFIKLAGVFAKKGRRKLKDSQRDKERARLHYDEMRTYAPNVRRLCAIFQADLPAIRSDFLSIC